MGYEENQLIEIVNGIIAVAAMNGINQLVNPDTNPTKYGLVDILGSSLLHRSTPLMDICQSYWTFFGFYPETGRSFEASTTADLDGTFSHGSSM